LREARAGEDRLMDISDDDVREFLLHGFMGTPPKNARGENSSQTFRARRGRRKPGERSPARDPVGRG
jgi:hypothetical protein